MENRKPRVWAEIGINHQGNMDIAMLMTRMASNAGCYGVKFQKRHPRTLLGDRYDTERTESRHNFGKTEGEHMEAREFTIEQHAELKSYAEGLGLAYSCSTWDMPSTLEILSLNPAHIKVASPMNQRTDILEAILEANVPVYHISLGMTTHEWRDELLEMFSGRRVVWYTCTSCYPCENADTCLKEISSISSIFYNLAEIDDSGYEYGFSGHHRGIAIDNAALALGATWFERHFTLDRTAKGTDHAASLEYAGLARLVRDLEATSSALCYRPDGGVLDCEVPSIAKLRDMVAQKEVK